MPQYIDISIVIPAYNEANRLPSFLEKLIAHCNNSTMRYEIIVFDDGSNDNTSEAIQKYKTTFPNLHIMGIHRNRGKGYAVKKGLLSAQGKVCGFLDADGSVQPQEIEKNIHYILDDGYDIFIGSRAKLAHEQIIEAKWYRILIGTVFNFFLNSFLFKEFRDTQCGFKLFRREVIEPLFSRSYLQGFGFDIEILYLAHKIGYKVKEGPVSWHHVDGSKINLVTDSISMFFNILQVRNWHCTPINTHSKYLEPSEYKFMYELEKYHWWFVSKNNLVREIIKSFGIPSPTILDVGMGTGANMLALSELGQTFGIDAAEQAMEFCKKRGLKNIARCHAEKITHPDKTFDVIIALDLLEHVFDPVKVLIELRRLLKDNGKIIITTPAFRMLWSQHDEALCHLRRYNKKTLSLDAAEARLKTDMMGYFFFSSFFPVTFIRLMRRLLPNRYQLKSDTTTLPPKFLNEFLKLIFKFEVRIFRRYGTPLGTTLYAILSK